MEFSGRLSAFPPSELLQWAKNDRRTGALVVRRSSREKRITFKDGEVVACLSDDPAEFYGQYLLLNGHLSEGELIRALTQCSKTGRRLGEQLQDHGVLTAEVVQRTLRSHIQDLIADVFLWNRGVFYFEAGVAPAEERLPLAIDTMGLALEGARWADEYQRIRRVLVHDEVVLCRCPGREVSGQSPLAQWIFGKVNDRRTLAQLYRATGGSYFRFLSATLSLCVAEVLDLKDVPLMASPVATTHEINLLDLMREQASEEQLLAMHRGGSVPLSAIENLVPLWMGAPPAEEPMAQVAARCDGTLRLSEMLPEDGSRDLDLFLSALSHGELCLLPAPVAELEHNKITPAAAPAQRWWRQVLPGVKR